MSASENTNELVLYVSPQGKDTWSGCLPDPSADGTDGPFASIERAMECIGSVSSSSGVKSSVTVYLRKGEYFLRDTLRFGIQNTGRAAALKAYLIEQPEVPVRFLAYRDELPTISGGRLLGDFVESSHNGLRLWSMDIPEVKQGSWYFTQLFVDGQRRYRPRLPRAGRFPIVALEKDAQDAAWNQGQTSFYFRPGDMQNWKNLEDVLFVPFFNWVDDHIPIKSVDLEKNRCVLSRKSCYRLGDPGKPANYTYCVENVFEALDRPGEWYLDRPTGKLYYLPLDSEEIGETQIVAPKLETLVDIASDNPDDPIEALHFEGIRFAHNEWSLPPNLEGVERGQGMPEAPAAIMLNNVCYSSFRNCTITNTANYGMMLKNGCHDVIISHCSIHHVGAGGIKMWHTCHRNTITDNEVCHIGEMFPAGIGILAGIGDGNKIIHNHVHHVYYSAISVGWDWGYVDRKRSCGNVIEWNYIHDVGQHMLADMGAIYLLGIATGTRVRYNCIHDIDSSGYGGWGIYPDEGSTDLLIENNLVYRTSSSPFNQTFGKDNFIHNNIFAFGNGYQIMQSRGEDHLTLIFKNNIFYFEKGELLGGHEGSFMVGNCKPSTAHFESNLYWTTSGEPTFMGKSLPQWQAAGFDQGSVIADPRFVDAQKGDFRLLSEENTRKIGFVPFDLSGVGPRRK